MRTILTTLFMTLATQVAALEFTEVYFCGKDLERSALTETRSEHWGNFYIHFYESDNKVVILHGGYQYSTLETRKYDELYAQNGAITLLKVKEKIGDLMKFELQDLRTGRHKTLLVDFSDLTYISRYVTPTQTYNPNYGVCEKSF